MQSIFAQTAYNIRCEWGMGGISSVGAVSDVVVIVDVLSFSTCIDVATERGAVVFPYRMKSRNAAEFAAARSALLASKRGEGAISLSPGSLASIEAGTRVVLPSPNGATLSLSTGAKTTLAGCLRNARAVARAAREMGESIAIIPAGERWPDGSLRPGIEDLLGAGAIIAELNMTKSPEALLAETAFKNASRGLSDILFQSASGRELVESGFGEDVQMAAIHNCSNNVPLLRGDAYLKRGARASGDS